MPAAHGAQLAEAVAPGDGETVPAGQFTHAAALLPDWYVPVEHVVHAAAPAAA